MDDYLQDRWLLVKLHGSVDWGRRVEMNGGVPAPKNRQKYLELFSRWPLAAEVADKIELVKTPELFDSTGSAFAPALSIPVDGKNDENCPPSHIEALQAFLPSCRGVLSIGTSGVDDDLLKLLRKGLANVEHFSVVDDSSSGQGPQTYDNFVTAVPQLAEAQHDTPEGLHAIPFGQRLGCLLDALSGPSSPTSL